MQERTLFILAADLSYSREMAYIIHIGALMI